MAEPRSAPLAAALEVDPFTALAVHFGMLLGVSDFQLLAANRSPDCFPKRRLRSWIAWSTCSATWLIDYASNHASSNRSSG